MIIFIGIIIERLIFILSFLCVGLAIMTSIILSIAFYIIDKIKEKKK